jgi:hypothetical protein
LGGFGPSVPLTSSFNQAYQALSVTIYQLLFRTVALTVGAYFLAETTGNITLSDQGNASSFVAYEPAPMAADTTGDSLRKSGRSPSLRWQDYYRNRFSDPRPRSSYYLDDPTNIGTTMRLDSTGRVVIEEDVKTPKGTLNYRPTESLDMNTYNEIQRQRAFETLMREYSARLDGKSAMGGRGLLPKLDLPPALCRARLRGVASIHRQPVDSHPAAAQHQLYFQRADQHQLQRQDWR